ncbi:MAG: PHB depolymerase family esterase [Anaerolineaceae bacterium]
MRLVAAAGILGTVLLQACSGGSPRGEFTFAAPVPTPTPMAGDEAPTTAWTGLDSLTVSGGSAGCGVAQTGSDLIDSVESPETDRSYRIHLPTGYNPNRPAPLVMNFHGSSKTALEQETYSGLGPVADRQGFILVSPEGSGWPQGWEVVGVYADSGTDDLVVTRQIVEAIEAAFCIDPQRIYATGHSNGAEMASQVGCFLPDIFAAVAPVSGVVYQGCDGRPMPVISLHGTEDYNVPFETAQPAMAEWASHNGCSTVEEIVQVTEHVSRESHLGCDGADVVLYVIDGGGHTWPDAEDFSGGAGPTTHEISANDLIWEFFASHPMPRN